MSNNLIRYIKRHKNKISIISILCMVGLFYSSTIAQNKEGSSHKKLKNQSSSKTKNIPEIKNSNTQRASKSLQNKITKEDNNERITVDLEKLPEIFYNDDVLPKEVWEMRRDLIIAARSGNIENLRPILERNELKPMISFDSEEKDPIKYWKEISSDGTGRDIMAEMIKVLSSGFVRTNPGSSNELYVWPYHYVYPLDQLTAEQEVELYLLISPEYKQDMEEAGGYFSFRAGIGKDGTLHFFVAGE